MTESFKNQMKKKNPKLVEKMPWFFSHDKFLIKIFGFMILIVIILIWTNNITIPSSK